MAWLFVKNYVSYKGRLDAKIQASPFFLLRFRSYLAREICHFFKKYL